MIVRIKRGAGDRSAETITASLCRTQEMCVSRGQRELDDPEKAGYWRVKAYTLRVPHRGAMVLPGAIISVTCTRLGLSAKKMRVKSYSISGAPGEIWGDMIAEVYTAP